MSVRRIKLKDGPGYKAVVSISRTKQISRNFRRKADAESWEREQRSLLSSGKIGVTLAGKKTVAELAEYWLKNYAEVVKCPSSTRRDCSILEHHILPTFGQVALSALTPRAVELWVSTLRIEKKLSAKTCNGCLGLLKKMLNDAVRWQFLQFNPIESVRPMTVEEVDFSFWTIDEVRTFLGFLKEQKPTFYLPYALALYCGLRRGEIKALRWDCVDLENRLLTIKRSFCFVSKEEKGTKSKRIRRVPIHPSLFDFLIQLRASQQGDLLVTDFDFVHSHRSTRELAIRAGVTPQRFHDLRHTFASNFMMQGGNIYDLQQLLGHSTIKMTERYSHMSPNHLTGKTDILAFELPEERFGGNVINLLDARI